MGEGEAEDGERVRVYIAGSLREAARVEEVLAGEGIEYAVEPEPFERRSLLFVREYMGAAFYVAAERGFAARAALEAAKLRKGLQPEE